MTLSTTLKYSMLNGIAILTLSACVYTDSDYQQQATQSGAPTLTSHKVKNQGEVAIYEDNVSGRKYQTIGTVNATARSVNLFSSDPTREDINEELRERAFEIGADAIILVKYQTESQGLASRGHMTATGQAVVFTEQ